ncbi:MAG: UvrB/UvrC motif-containing protein [Gemmataceae bacterium]|nr:UvrB/UvrC motif-containing protein [Gemmataceae bacterium]MCI0738585.1 UvrB/UvrC motif-containing protein [Gemmataceae bacterium]
MNQDIDFMLKNWEHKPGVVQARLVQARDGRQVIQMRLDLGVLQMETRGKPDGAQPHGHDSYYHYLREQERLATKAGRSFVMSEEQCQEADREFLQFYHRRICWLALRQYARAMEDADHTIGLMDFVKLFSPSDEYTMAHEQYRGFVIFQRTQAAAAFQVEKSSPEGAIDELRSGLDSMRRFFADHEMEEQFDEDGMVQHLRKVEQSLRQEYQIGTTLKEQLDEAIAAEDYEKAARIRDELKQRQEP